MTAAFWTRIIKACAFTKNNFQNTHTYGCLLITAYCLINKLVGNGTARTYSSMRVVLISERRRLWFNFQRDGSLYGMNWCRLFVDGRKTFFLIIFWSAMWIIKSFFKRNYVTFVWSFYWLFNSLHFPSCWQIVHMHFKFQEDSINGNQRPLDAT